MSAPAAVRSPCLLHFHQAAGRPEQICHTDREQLLLDEMTQLAPILQYHGVQYLSDLGWTRRHHLRRDDQGCLHHREII